MTSQVKKLLNTGCRGGAGFSLQTGASAFRSVGLRKMVAQALACDRKLKLAPPEASSMERSRSARDTVRLIRPQHTTQRGFTLLEVLVAAVIMGLAVAGAMSAIASSSRNASRLTQYDRAVTLARQKMDELLVDRDAPRNVPLSGNWDPPISNAGWNARVAPFEAPPSAGVGGGVLDRVELEIWWMDGQTRRAFTLEGFRRNTIRPGDVISAQ